MQSLGTFGYDFVPRTWRTEDCSYLPNDMAWDFVNDMEEFWFKDFD